MEQVLIVSVFAAMASLLTLFCGFGLGTIMLPVFSIFFPAELAVMLTAILHFGNNLFKLVLLGRAAVRSIVFLFGVPSLLAAIVGAYMLSMISGSTLLSDLSLPFGSDAEPVKFVIGALIVIFAILEVAAPRLKPKRYSAQLLITGGMLSGFFGGISGHQGALRTTFLAGMGLSKYAFVATGVVIACMVDIARISVYFPGLIASGADVDPLLIGSGLVAAFTGAVVGNRVLGKMELPWLMNLVAFLLVIFGMLMMTGAI